MPKGTVCDAPVRLIFVVQEFTFVIGLVKYNYRTYSQFGMSALLSDSPSWCWHSHSWTTPDSVTMVIPDTFAEVFSSAGLASEIQQNLALLPCPKSCCARTTMTMKQLSSQKTIEGLTLTCWAAAALCHGVGVGLHFQLSWLEIVGIEDKGSRQTPGQ